MRSLCLSFSFPLLGIMQFPCASLFSQASSVAGAAGQVLHADGCAELRAASCCKDIAPYGAFQPRFSP